MKIHKNDLMEAQIIPDVENEEAEIVCEGEPEACEIQQGEAAQESDAEETAEISEDTVDDLASKKQRLEEEIAMLESELESKRAETDRKIREYAEFRELFPEVDVSELDPQVLESVENGVPLCAAYALYEKRLAAKNAAALAHNKATRRDGFGSVGRGSEGEFYSPDEVRAMTQSEVKQNYQKILRSMKNWH